MIREDKCSFTQYFQTHANWVIYCAILLNDNSRILFITYDVGVFFKNTLNILHLFQKLLKTMKEQNLDDFAYYSKQIWYVHLTAIFFKKFVSFALSVSYVINLIGRLICICIK